MRRIGAAKAASHADALTHHRALPLAERLRRSWELYLHGRTTAQVVHEDPVEFYDRARALGLYRP
jgi:hypothetical protein